MESDEPVEFVEKVGLENYNVLNNTLFTSIRSKLNDVITDKNIPPNAKYVDTFEGRSNYVTTAELASEYDMELLKTQTALHLVFIGSGSTELTPETMGFNEDINSVDTMKYDVAWKRKVTQTKKYQNEAKWAKSKQCILILDLDCIKVEIYALQIYDFIIFRDEVIKELILKVPESWKKYFTYILDRTAMGTVCENNYETIHDVPETRVQTSKSRKKCTANVRVSKLVKDVVAWCKTNEIEPKRWNITIDRLFTVILQLFLKQSEKPPKFLTNVEPNLNYVLDESQTIIKENYVLEEPQTIIKENYVLEEPQTVIKENHSSSRKKSNQAITVMQEQKEISPVTTKPRANVKKAKLVHKQEEQNDNSSVETNFIAPVVPMAPVRNRKRTRNSDSSSEYEYDQLNESLGQLSMQQSFANESNITTSSIASTIAVSSAAPATKLQSARKTVISQLKSWRDLMRESNSTSFEAVQKQFGLCFDKKSTILELPIPIELTTHHTIYGDITAIGILWWVDKWDPKYDQPAQRDTLQIDYFTPDVDEDGVTQMKFEPRRICFFHSIQEIVGDGKFTPAAAMIGKMFSSLHFSANLIGKRHENGFEKWRVLGTNIKIAHFLKGNEKNGNGFMNYPDFMELDMIFKGTSVPRAVCRDLMAVLCKDECNKFVCKDQTPCKHGLVHRFEKAEVSKELKAWEPSDMKKQEKIRLEERTERLSTPWGKAIWFEDASSKEVIYNFSWPGWSETFIKTEFSRIHRKFFPHIPLQLSYYYIFPESFLDNKLENAIKLLRYFKFMVPDNVNGRIAVCDNKDNPQFEADNDNPLFSARWSLDNLTYRLFEPQILNPYTKDRSYGTFLRIPMRLQLLEALCEQQITHPLNEQFNPNPVVQTDVSTSVFHQFLMAESSSSIGGEHGIEEQKPVSQLVVSPQGLLDIKRDFIERAPEIVKVLNEITQRCYKDLEAKRTKYFDKTQFYNPSKNANIERKKRSNQEDLNYAEEKYLKYCLAAAHYKRAQETYEEGLMLKEREMVMWYNDRRQASHDPTKYTDPNPDSEEP